MTMERTAAEQFLFLSNRAAEVMAERIEKELPATGSFEVISVTFTVPEQNRKVCLITEPSLTGAANMRRLSAAVRLGSSYHCQSYICHDTNENLIAHLQRETTAEELVDLFRHLSEKASEE